MHIDANADHNAQRTAGLASHVDQNTAEFAGSGFTAFAPRWRTSDYLRGQSVTISSGSQRFSGIAQGIADDGALLVEVGGVLMPVFSADVTLRREP